MEAPRAKGDGDDGAPPVDGVEKGVDVVVDDAGDDGEFSRCCLHID
jgi:hypothetical protein